MVLHLDAEDEMVVGDWVVYAGKEFSSFFEVRPFLFDQVRLTSMTLCLCFLSGLWLVDPVLSKAKLVQVLINVAPMNLQKLSKKVVIVLIILPILGILYCACKSTMPATASVSPAPRQETTN